jgi:hypothetical protein
VKEDVLTAASESEGDSEVSSRRGNCCGSGGVESTPRGYVPVPVRVTDWGFPGGTVAPLKKVGPDRRTRGRLETFAMGRKM